MKTIMATVSKIIAERSKEDLPKFSETYFNKYIEKYNLDLTYEQLDMIAGKGIDYLDIIGLDKPLYTKFVLIQERVHDQLLRKFHEWQFPINKNTRMFLADWSHCIADLAITHLRCN